MLKDTLFAVCLALILFWILGMPWFGHLPDLGGLLHFSAWTAGAALLWLLVFCLPVSHLLRKLGWEKLRWVRWTLAIVLSLLPVVLLYTLFAGERGGGDHGSPEVFLLMAAPWVLAFSVAGIYFLGRRAKLNAEKS